MATYRNTSQGGRYIHLNTGQALLVDAGRTVTVEEGRIKRVGPDLVRAKKDDLPDPPAALAAQVKKDAAAAKKPAAKKPAADPKAEIKALRADYEKKTGKKAFTGWKADELKRRIAAA